MSIEAYKAGYIDGVAAGVRYKQRCYELEQLCRDVWNAYCDKAETSFHPVWHVDNDFTNRMDALGLLEVDE